MSDRIISVANIPRLEPLPLLVLVLDILYVVDELSEDEGKRHTVHVTRGARHGRVEISVGVDPHHTRVLIHLTVAVDRT